ncbi:MAG: GreA/GreB family elongation factor, partial [Thiobacillus sp.]
NDDVFHASFESAVGAALLGKKVGDLVTYQTPNGKNLSMTIKAIENT